MKSYIDKLLKEISLRFRDQYKNELENGFQAALKTDFDAFTPMFNALLKKVEKEAKSAKPAAPRSFENTDKFKNTVEGSGLIEKKEWKVISNIFNILFSSKNSNTEDIET